MRMQMQLQLQIYVREYMDNRLGLCSSGRATRRSAVFNIIRALRAILPSATLFRVLVDWSWLPQAVREALSQSISVYISACLSPAVRLTWFQLTLWAASSA